MTHTPATVQAASSPDGVWLIVEAPQCQVQFRLTAERAERLEVALRLARLEHGEMARERAAGN
jgi:hypothetical protein